MKKSFIDWVEIEVTPEEEEAWQNFLTKQYELKQREINLETTIPKEIKDGIQ
jgi:hypothetical protein